jgi:DedD protein
MARGSGQRGGGDRVLESRHLAGLFLGVVVLCGVFFTLGYVMGRTQYGSSAVHAAATRDNPAIPDRTAEKPPAEAAPGPVAAPAPANAEWDFYTKKDNDHLEPAAKAAPPAANASPVAAGKSTPAAARFGPPRMLKGAIVVQVAALTRESDALAMADALQQKKFPSFVVAPASDNFYRVQVGPYPDERAAQTARGALERGGFKGIVKR